jgi:hypothetical protein
VPTRPRSPSPSARWGRPVGASFLRARALLTLSRGPRASVSAACSLARSRWSVGPTCQTYPSRTARTHAEATPAPPRPFLATSCPTHSPSSPTRSLTHLSTCLAPRAHPGSSTTVRRGLGPVPRPPSRPCRVRCPGELHLDVSNSGHPWVRPFPLYLSLLALTGSPPCSQSPAAIDPKPPYISMEARQDSTTRPL